MGIARKKAMEQAFNVLNRYEILSKFNKVDPIIGCNIPIIKILKSNGFKIIYKDLPQDTSCVIAENNKHEKEDYLVFINSNYPRHRQRFNMAFAIGYKVLHSIVRPMIYNDESILLNLGKGYNYRDKKYVEADIFAAELLIPMHYLNGQIRLIIGNKKKPAKYDMVVYLAKIFNVSVALMSMKLGSLGCII